MADYKDYIVRYDIQADITKAAEGLQKIAGIAEQFDGPMKTLQATLGQVSRSLQTLKDSSKLSFEPRIDVKAFNNQLKRMVIDVKSAAAEMHSALFEAMKGNTKAVEAMKQSIGKSLGVRTLKDIRSEYEAFEKEYNKLMGTPKKTKKGNIREKDGSIEMAKNAGMTQRAVELKARATAIKNKLRQLKEEAAVVEKAEQEAAKEREKASKQIQKKAATTAAVAAPVPTPVKQVSRMTNVTPEVIKEWKKAFGDAKSKALTINIKGNATGKGGALTVISEIQASLATLQSKAHFEINPLLNNEGFVAAETRLAKLAALSKSVISPFADKGKAPTKGGQAVAGLTKDERLKYEQAKQNAKAWGDKANYVQKRLEENKAKYATSPTSVLKGQITRDEKRLADYRNAQKQHEETVKQYQSKIPAATQNAAKNVKPLSLDVIGNLTSLNVGAKEYTVPVVGKLTKVVNEIKEAIPVNVKIAASQVAESLKALPPQSITVSVILDTKAAKDQIAVLGAQAKTTKSNETAASVKPVVTPSAPTPKKVFPKLTKAEEAKMNQLFTTFPQISKEQETAAKKVASAQKKLAKSNSDANFAAYREADSKFGIARQKYIEAFNQLKPLMIKQFQSTASRVLTDKEALKGYEAQNTVSVLSAKKQLTDAQKKQLEKAKATLTSLRAPEQPAPVTQPVEQKTETGKGKTGVVSQKQQKPSKAAKGTTVDAVANVTGIKSSKELTIPVSGEITKVISKLTNEITVPVVGKLTKIINKYKGTTEISVVGNLTKISNKLPNAINVPVVGKVKTGDIKDQIKGIKSASVPVMAKLKWDKGESSFGSQIKKLSDKPKSIALNLDTKKAISQLESFIAKIKASSPQTIQLNANGAANSAAKATTTTASVIASSTSSANAGSTSDKTSKKSKASLTAAERYANMKAFAEKRTLGTKQTIAKWQEYAAKENKWRAERQKMYDKLFGNPWNSKWYYDEKNKRATELSKMREDARSAFEKGPTPYEKKLEQQRKDKVARSIVSKQKEAEKLRANLSNSLIPFAQNKEQLNLMMKHRKFFKRAIESTGIMPTPNMSANEMMTYLQGVSRQMQKASVAVPWQLQNQMNKLQMAMDKANGISVKEQQARTYIPRYKDTKPTIINAPRGTSERRVSAAPRQRTVNFYDTARKWSYPFTGNTSFGARTPMAVDMAKGMGVMFAVGGAMSAIGDSFSQAMQYQNTMRTTKAILENGTPSYTQYGFTNMEKTVRDVGIKTKFSAPEVASAARFLAMAGYDINAINNAIRPIADLALIGDTDLGETADKMTNVMTTFKIAPEKMRAAANIMTNTFTKSNTDLMMLAESAKYAGGITQLYGGNYENNFADVMAMFGIMGNAGIQASSAGTTLRMMYQNLMQPNKNQRKTLQENNIVTRDANNRPLEMVAILEQIAKLDKNKIPDVVGKLFRITAQPGSAALLNDLTGGDETMKQQVLNANEWLIGKLSNGTGSKLVDLMASNREAANGTISKRIALEKQSTIQGLWAQVTSTFTEGVVKAFEGREGDFTNKLTKLRNYFAKPDTVQMIQNLLDMVVSVGETLAWFARLWANFYNFVPGLIKTWVATQLFFTQLGALISPIVSLIGALSRLKQIVLGVSGAVAAVSGVSATKTAASIASSAARYSTPASLAAQTASNGLAATTIPAGTRRGIIRVPYTKYVGQSQIYEFPRQSLKGIKAPMTGLTAAQSAATAFIAKDIAMWSRSHDYQMGGMPKYERKRLNKSIDRKVAELRGQMPKPQSSVILPPGFGLGYVPLSQSGRNIVKKRYATAAVRPLAIGRYADTVGAVLYGGRTLPQYTEAYKQRADMWKRLAQKYQRTDPETGKILPPVVGSKEYEYRQKVATYSRAAATGMKLRAEHGLYVGESIAMAMQRRAIAKDIARQRHAARGLMGWDASGRMISRYGFKGTAGKAYAMGLNAATTALSFSGLFGNIKSMFQKVGVMLASFAGALKGAVVSLGPWALLAASVVAVGIGWHKFLKGIKDREEREKNAVRSASDAAEKARNTRYNTGKLLNKKYLGTTVAKATELSNYVGNVNAEKNNIAKFYKEYKDVLVPITTTEGMKASNEAWSKALYNHNNYLVAFNTPLGSHINNNIVGNRNNVTKAQLNASLDESAFVTYFAGQRAAIDESNKQRMADAVTLAGASSNTTLTAQEQIIELRKKLMSNELSMNNFIAQANAIKNATANPKALNLFDAEKMTANDLKNRDWTYSIQYQQGIYNALTAEIEGRIGTISGYLMAENALKNNLIKNSDEWYKAVAKILAMRDGVIEGVQYHISMLPNGQIDFNGILEQLKLKVKDFNLTMEKFAAMTASAYSMLLELGVVNDNSYSAYIKFNRQQNKNTPLKKEDYEAYYNQLVREHPRGQAARVGLNAWVADAMNGKNKLTWERRVRNFVSDNAAVRQKRENDKKIPKPSATVKNTPGANTNNANGTNNGNNGGGNNGTNGNSGNGGKNTPSDARDQKQYASHYDRGSARPTHISINIDHLAHFTDTKVVSTAEERDIISTIEDKISSTLYTIIAEAANRANNIVDRT
jgi:TP901 family phage tail tape measure protein